MTRDTSKPAACPFCDSEKTCIFEEEEYYPAGFQVWCRSCQARGPIKDNQLQARVAWGGMMRAEVAAELFDPERQRLNENWKVAHKK